MEFAWLLKKGEVEIAEGIGLKVAGRWASFALRKAFLPVAVVDTFLSLEKVADAHEFDPTPPWKRNWQSLPDNQPILVTEERQSIRDFYDQPRFFGLGGGWRQERVRKTSRDSYWTTVGEAKALSDTVVSEEKRAFDSVYGFGGLFSYPSLIRDSVVRRIIPEELGPASCDPCVA